jgi:flagellar basal body rod protein FlgG
MFRNLAIFLILILETLDVYASSNAFYITLSNQIARRRQLEVVAHNTANTNTIGFEADSVLFKKFDIKESRKKKNSFVLDTATYRSEDQGALQRTNRPLDIAIVGEDSYFKVQTPRGVRYTLNGSLYIDSMGVVVNAQGYPYLSIDNQQIVLPDNIVHFQISKDGAFFVDDEEIGRIGVFLIPEKYALIKESDGLARSKIPDVVAGEYTIIDNTLRMSNVNPTKSMTQMVELQRSIGMTTGLMSDLNDLHKSTLQKVAG